MPRMPRITRGDYRMSGFGVGLNMGQEALDHLRHMRGPKRKIMTIPLAGNLGAAGVMEEPVAVPLGWKWTLKRWSWTADAAGAAQCLMFAGTVDRTNLVEVSTGIAPVGGFSAFADAIGNNAELRGGERILFQWFGATAGGIVTVRLQVEAALEGTEPKQVMDFEREDYEDAPPEEHIEHTAVGGVVTPHPLQPLADLIRRQR